MRSQAKAKAIDTTKDKIYYAGAALLLGLAAMALFSNSASAQTAIVQDEQVQNQAQKTNKIESEWTPHVQVQDQVTVPFQLKSQKLSH